MNNLNAVLHVVAQESQLRWRQQQTVKALYYSSDNINALKPGVHHEHGRFGQSYCSV